MKVKEAEGNPLKTWHIILSVIDHSPNILPSEVIVNEAITANGFTVCNEFLNHFISVCSKNRRYDFPISGRSIFWIYFNVPY